MVRLGQWYLVDLWVREEEVYHQIKRERVNRSFLPGMKLVPQLNPVRSFEEVLSDKNLVMMIVPSHVFREVLNHMKPYLRPEMALMAATKGIENDTLKICLKLPKRLYRKGVPIFLHA